MGNPRSIWAMEYHSKDAGKLFLKTSSHQLSRDRGTIHIYAPGTVYWEDTREAMLPIQETYLIFTDGDACGLDKLTNNEFHFARFLDTGDHVGKLLIEAARCCAALGDGAFWKVQSLFAEAVFHLLRGVGVTGYTRQALPDGPEASGVMSFSQEVERYLQRNLRRSVKLSDIAAHMKTSESLLSHKFKTEKGVSPIARLITMRVDLAKNMLLKGEKLKIVSELTGFCDEYQLSKTFKSVTGLSPRDFKKKEMPKT